MKNINIYIHTWKINNWREILNEQLSQIDESGLGDTASIHICNSDAEKKTWFEMWKHSLDNDSYYLYLQNLGITWQGTIYEDITANWRKWIMVGVVENWKEYVSQLAEYDAVGDDWKDTSYYRDWHPNKRKYKDSDLAYPKHFAPQMWWTKSSHLNKLENPIEYQINKIENSIEYQKYSVSDLVSERVIIEGWLTSHGENFKELRNDFTLEPLSAYNNPHLKNIPR
ncbi:MAG: hypothetical protein H8E03_00465 [Pelagibacteraceae bacterium]|nr:hypothetical protein [Pelagibacteraceae bacterium]